MLDQIPAEILAHIAYHLSTSTLSPPTALLQSCKAIHDAISPSSNHRLYGRLFRHAFDIAAPTRRLGKAALHAGDVTRELRRRVVALRRIAAMVQRQDVSEVHVEDLWVVYIMLIENDGLNIGHFIQADGSMGAVPLDTFLRLYHEQHLITAALEPGYPPETTERALVMWISWLLAGYESTRGFNRETEEQRDERLFVLRPYVFAPQRYDLYFAPWTIADLPILTTQPAANPRNPFVADLTPKSRLHQVQHFGRTIDISGPFLAHAAILLFFVKRPGARVDDARGLLLPIQALMAERNGVNHDDNVPEPQVHNSDLHTATNGTPAATDDQEKEDDGDETFGSIRDLIANSAHHDRDFARLRACYDPFSCRGMKRSAWRGSWEGSWEGNFSFFDFEAFKAMLVGQSRALYEGEFGEQAQVWRVTETWVWRESWGKEKAKQRQREKEARARARRIRIENGEDVSDDEEEAPAEVKDKGKGKARGLPLTGPATNAGFPTDMPVSTSAGLASASAEAITLRETIQQQVDALEGFEIVPEAELEDALNEDDAGEGAGLEMILTGTGHSAWGRFILKGKVRAWDGMASLVKEYAPDSRGKWIYRGYIVSGDIFVGRWRDTLTPAEYVGYEGTFILNRRK